MLRIIKENILYIFLAFCLIASAIVIVPNGLQLYLIGLAILFFQSIKDNTGNKNKERGAYILFIVICLLSSIINFVFDQRLFIFILTLVACSPITLSTKIVKFREKYLFCCLMIFPLLSVISLYCYFAGINCFLPDDNDVSWDFSALFPHPMWLAAAVGLANGVILWLVFECKKNIFKYFFLILLFFSLFLSVVAASRSALSASLISLCIIFLIKSKNVKKLILYICLTSVILSLTFPIYYKSSERMQAKMEYSKENKFGSRELHFSSGFKHLADEPLLGSGFATAYYGNQKVVGRLESGSGWLSILFQTGFAGFLVVCGIILRLKKNLKYLKTNSKLQLYFVSFCFLCFHSCFEGYILTSGYYLCVLFWMLIGILDIYPRYITIIEENNER